MNKLSSIPAPAIAGVIREKTVASAIAEIKNCYCDGANMIDLHLSCLENDGVDSIRAIVESTKLPILALNYNKSTAWEELGLSEDERTESFLRAVDAGCAGIDMQGYTFHAPSREGFFGEDKYSFTKGNPKEIVTDSAVIAKQCELINKAHEKGAEVLLSCHPAVPMKAECVVELALFLEKRSPDIIKIVTPATNEDEMLESIKAMLLLKKEVRTPVSYHASGKFGGLTRVVNPALGGQIAFCVDRFSESSTFEQLDLKTAKSVIDGITKIL